MAFAMRPTFPNREVTKAKEKNLDRICSKMKSERNNQEDYHLQVEVPTSIGYKHSKKNTSSSTFNHDEVNLHNDVSPSVDPRQPFSYHQHLERYSQYHAGHNVHNDSTHSGNRMVTNTSTHSHGYSSESDLDDQNIDVTNQYTDQKRVLKRPNAGQQAQVQAQVQEQDEPLDFSSKKPKVNTEVKNEEFQIPDDGLGNVAPPSPPVCSIPRPLSKRSVASLERQQHSAARFRTGDRGHEDSAGSPDSATPRDDGSDNSPPRMSSQPSSGHHRRLIDHRFSVTENYFSDDRNSPNLGRHLLVGSSNSNSLHQERTAEHYRSLLNGRDTGAAMTDEQAHSIRYNRNHARSPTSSQQQQQQHLFTLENQSLLAKLMHQNQFGRPSYSLYGSITDPARMEANYAALNVLTAQPARSLESSGADVLKDAFKNFGVQQYPQQGQAGFQLHASEAVPRSMYGLPHFNGSGHEGEFADFKRKMVYMQRSHAEQQQMVQQQQQMRAERRKEERGSSTLPLLMTADRRTSATVTTDGFASSSRSSSNPSPAEMSSPCTANSAPPPDHQHREDELPDRAESAPARTSSDGGGGGDDTPDTNVTDGDRHHQLKRSSSFELYYGNEDIDDRRSLNGDDAPRDGDGDGSNRSLHSSSSNDGQTGVTRGGGRKRGRSLPDELKDGAYWERRRKNNEAAKRSRDARRAKEDEIAIRAAFLEQENLKLRVEVGTLKNETAKLRCLLFNS